MLAHLSLCSNSEYVLQQLLLKIIKLTAWANSSSWKKSKNIKLQVSYSFEFWIQNYRFPIVVICFCRIWYRVSVEFAKLHGTWSFASNFQNYRKHGVRDFRPIKWLKTQCSLDISWTLSFILHIRKNLQIFSSSYVPTLPQD